MARDRIDNASSKAEYVRLTFADRKTAKRADRVAYFDFDIEEDARIMRRSRLDRVRGKLEANGIAWSESETSLTTEQVEDMQDREPANERSPSESERRCELIEAETDELERHRWEVFYEADGVKVLGESFVPDHEPLMHFSTVGDRPGIGDLYVSWDAEQPNEMNQSLRRVVGLGEHGSFELGPAIPRSEWPEEMRGATLPVKLRVDRGKVGEPGRIALLDGGGKEIFSYVDQGAREGWHERRDMIVDAIEKAVWSGGSDARAGKRREIAIQKDGRRGASDSRSWWAVGDGAGSVTFVEPRRPFSPRPPKLVEDVLGAARAAYAEGHREALELRAAWESRPAALSM